MKERKYKEDYGFSTTIDSKGREKRKAVYRGDYYSYPVGQESGKPFVAALLLFLICAVLFLLYMLLNSPSSRCIYVMPISACALVPLVYWGMGLFTMWRAPRAMTRLQRENGIGRVLRSTVGCSVLLGVACIGDLLFMALSLRQRWLEELPAFALLLCSAMCAMGCFLRIRELYTGMKVIAGTKGSDEE